MSTPQVLIISDDRVRVEKIRYHLRALGSWEMVEESTAGVAQRPLGLMIADTVVIDFDGLSDRSLGKKWVLECRHAFRPVPVVVLREYYDDVDARACFDLGVSDFLSLADHSERLAHVISALAIESAVASGASALPGVRNRLCSPRPASTRTA